MTPDGAEARPLGSEDELGMEQWEEVALATNIMATVENFLIWAQVFFSIRTSYFLTEVKEF